jgi:hypothetical protein
LDTTPATYVQNWLHIWKPFILSSVKSANNLALQGVRTMATYFTPTGKLCHRPLANRAHRTACMYQLMHTTGVKAIFSNRA